MATSPLVVYHGAPTRSARIIVALDELGKLDAAEIKPVDFFKGEHQVSGMPGGRVGLAEPLQRCRQQHAAQGPLNA